MYLCNTNRRTYKSIRYHYCFLLSHTCFGRILTILTSPYKVEGLKGFLNFKKLCQSTLYGEVYKNLRCFNTEIYMDYTF